MTARLAGSTYPTGVRRYPTPLESLMARRRITTEGCWEWTGSVSRDCRRWGGEPYGRIHVGGSTRYVHRVAYELLVGPIPTGLTIDHLCRNTLCFNPEHLEPVTGRVNILRGEGVAAERARQSQCVKGHPLSGENLYEYTDRKGYTRRYCRACRVDAVQTWRLIHAHKS